MGVAVASGPTFGEAAGGTVIIAAPSGVTDKDWLLAVLISDNDGDATAMTAPPGWAPISSSADTVSALGGFGRIWTRRAVDAGGGPYSFPAGAGSDNNGFLFRISGGDPVQLFAAPPVWANPGVGATTALIAPSVNPGGSGLLFCVFMLEGMFGGSITAPGGMSGTSVLSGTGFLNTLLGFETVGPGPTGPRTATASTSGASNTQGYLTASFVLADDTSTSYGGWFLGPPTLGRPWVPQAPQWAGGESVAPAQIEPTTGAGTLGLGAAAQPRKVATVTAVAGVALAGIAQSGKRAPVAAPASVGLDATVTARKRSGASVAAATGITGICAVRKAAPAAALATAGINGSVAARKRLTATSQALGGFSAAGVAAKRSTTSGRAASGAAPAAAARKSGLVAGLTPAGVAGSASVGTVASAAAGGRGWLGISASATTRKICTPTAATLAALTPRTAAAKTTPATAGAPMGLTGANLARKVTAAAAAAQVGLAGASTARKTQVATARSALATAATAITPRRIQVTARALAALTARAGAAKRFTATGRACLGVRPYADLTPPKAPHLVPAVRRMATALPGRTGQPRAVPGGRLGPTIEGGD